MAKPGDLVEFKPGTFGIEIPENFGIFIKRYRDKNRKVNMVSLYTTKGIQKTKQSNVNKKNFGKSMQLEGDRLPKEKELKKRLLDWMRQVHEADEKIQSHVSETLTERTLWDKITETGKINLEEQEIAQIWYGVGKEDISKSRIRKVREILNACRPYGQEYFDVKASIWTPISQEQRKEVGAVISHLGSLR
ncbi:MAG: hypothetical protein KAR20_25410, partial [Candidatus Heimdallarchaeota archaeon]|nr:hypothetical protein [Candidatus Heimdallarchaeota archaeon]